MADYGGSFIFGNTVTIIMDPTPSEHQDIAFFGLNGKYSLFGGTRGRTFRIKGFLPGSNPGAVAAARDSFESFDDGIARTLTDNQGVTWANVLYREFHQTGAVTWGSVAPNTMGWLMPYEALFEGLS